MCFQIAPNKIIIEENEKSLETWLEELGVEALKVPFRDVFEFGGALHCSTWDINRDDEKKAYITCEDHDTPEHGSRLV